MKKIIFLFISVLCFYQGISQVTRIEFGEMIFNQLYSANTNPNSYDAAYYPNPFIDLSDATTIGKKIKILSYLEYQTDAETPFFRNSNFNPLVDISRGNAIRAIVQAWDFPSVFYVTSPFNDVFPGDLYYGEFCAAYDYGLISGGTLNPYASINNIEAQDYMTWISNSSFDPVSYNVLSNPDNYFTPHLYTQENLGMFKGLEQGVFSHYAKNSFVIPDIQTSLYFSHFYSTAMVELPEFYFPVQPLTRGWSHTYNIYAQRKYVDTDNDGDEEEIFYITWADGTIHIYNSEFDEWVTEGVYNEAGSVGINGVPHLNVWTKDHKQYRFKRIDSDLEIFYLIEISDKNGNDIEIDYESADAQDMERIEKVISPSGKELIFDYFGNSDRLREIRDPINRDINFSYSNGRLIDFTDAKGNETEYSYVTNNTGNNFERFLLKEIELPNNNKIEATYSSTQEGYLNSYKVNNNTPIQYIYTIDFSQSTPVTIYMDVPMPDGGTDQHTSEYNSLGLLETFQSGTDDIVITYPSVSSSNPFLPSQVSNHNIEINYEYDSNGNVEKIDYEDGDRVYEFDWNSDNELMWSQDPRNNRTDYEYDGDHNLIKIIDPFQKEINLNYFPNGNLMYIKNQEDIQIDFTYHADGPLESFSAPEDISGTFAYDDINRLLSKNINGLTSSYSYDDNDNILTFTNSGQHTTVFSYDDNDNVASIINANTIATVFAYNEKDQIESETFDSLETGYTYNDDDTLDEVDKPSGQSIQMDYTNNGQYDGSGTVTNLTYDNNERVSGIESLDVEYSFTYDNLNQIELVEIDGENRDVAYDYDSAGNILNINYPNVGSDARIRYFYDAKNRLTRIRAVNFNSLSNTNIADYTYLDDDRISQIEYGNGFITTYTYDTAGRPTGIQHRVNDDVYYDEVRTLNNRGNVLDLKVGYRSTDVPIYEPTEDVQSFQYNTNNHINSSGYVLDDDGNTTANPIGTFTYDIDDQARQRTANSITSQYEYDAFNNRTKRTESNSIDKEYLWDIISKNIIQEYNIGSGDDPRSYAYGLGLEARIINGVLSYYHGDLRGNVVLITDADGNRIRDYQYSPFGIPSGVNPAANPDNNEFTFLGKFGIIEDDRDVGLYYIRARYYDATIGRFITEDPVQSSNLYVYGGNNPIKNIDRNGQFIETAADVVSLGASIYDFGTDPSLTNGLFLAWDIVGLVPGVPGSWSAKVIKKGVGYADEAIQGGSAVGKKGGEIAENVSVYVSKNIDGTIQYVGITNDIARRQIEHFKTKGIFIERLNLQNLSRADAKAVEQALIEVHGLQKNGGTLLNKINSISNTRPEYATQLRRGYQLLKSIGY